MMIFSRVKQPKGQTRLFLWSSFSEPKLVSQKNYTSNSALTSGLATTEMQSWRGKYTTQKKKKKKKKHNTTMEGAGDEHRGDEGVKQELQNKVRSND